MSNKVLPPGICDHCGRQFPPGVSLTTRRGPRRYCSVDCRNTANARAGAATIGAKNKQRIAAGRWRNPALTPEARAKLSRPRAHADDPVLHAAFEKLRHGHMADLDDAERAAWLAYRKRRQTALAARRTPEQIAELRARWRAYWRKRQTK